MNRQGATSKGLKKRIRDLELHKVWDPRDQSHVKHHLPAILTMIITGVVTFTRSMRQLEERTVQIATRRGEWMGIKERIADNTLGRALVYVKPSQMNACFVRLVKAEHRRGNLKSTRSRLRAVAIDGKNVATLRWHDLCRVLGLDEGKATPEQVKALLAERHPDAQFCVPTQGKPYALIRVHTVTLLFSNATFCIYLRPTFGHSNEIGSMPALLDELNVAYGRTRLFDLITTDAGNISKGVAKKIIENGWNFFSQIKSGQGAIFEEAVRVLGDLSTECAEGHYVDKQNGQVIEYHAWRYDLSEQGWLDWPHGRQLIRVQRTATSPKTGEVTVGNRFYVTSMPPSALGPRSILKLSRAHWRCENNTHWTADVELQEDRRRLAWSRHPNGVLVMSVIRMIALFILALARQMTRLAYSRETPSWAQVGEHFLLTLCGSILETKAFDEI